MKASKNTGELMAIIFVFLFANMILGKPPGTCIEKYETGEVYRIIKMVDLGFYFVVQKWDGGWVDGGKIRKYSNRTVDVRCP